MEKCMLRVSCLSFVCVLLILGQARGIEIGGEPIARPLNNTRDNTTIIINPGQTIGIAGLLVGFKAFMLNTKDCIWLHVWRKALGGYPSMHTLGPHGSRGYTTPSYTTPTADHLFPRNPGNTTMIAAVGYPYWMMIGKTTTCVRAKKEGEVFTYNIPPEKYIRVEKDDVIGFSAQSSSPIPYSVNTVSCTVNNMSLESQSSMRPRYLRQDRVYAFGELHECRTYSLRAIINQKECKRITATNVSKNLTISTTGRTESECWILQPAAAANESKLHTELMLNLREFNRSCRSIYYSKLEIRKGNSSTSPKIMSVCSKPGRYSRYRNIEPITTGSAYVEFKRKGFSTRLINVVLEYFTVTTAPCMRVRVGDNPTYIESPGYPYHDYPSNIKICWILSIPNESTDRIRVVLDMENVDIQPANKACRPWDNSCTVCNDYIEVRDGNDSNAPLLAKWCNNTGKDLLETGSNQELIVYFVTDGSLQRGGFKMQAFTVMPETVACFHYIGLSTPAMIESPYYPNSYPGRRDDCWSIRARSKKQRILLTIKDSYLATGASSPRGSLDPPWVFRRERPVDNPSGLCATSKIDVRDGVGSTAPLLRRWCRKTVPEPILSSGPYLFIHFVKSRSNTARFAMSYQQLDSEACTTFYAYPHLEYLKQEVNQSTSLGVHCWILRSEGGRLRIRWESPYQHDTTQTNNCNQNYIQVHDGESEASRRIGSFCGDNPIPEGGIESNGSALYIQWVVTTFPAKLQIGYRELSSLNCDITLMKRSEMYFTHDGPEKTESRGGFIGGGSTGVSGGSESGEPQPVGPCPNCKYKANTQKCWTVTARDPKDRLLVKVIFLELQQKNNQSRCVDFLELYDGESTSDPLLTKSCGTGIQRNFTTTGRSMRIIFQSDEHVELRGFRLEISIVQEGGCKHLQAQNYNLTFDAMTSLGSYSGRDGSVNKDKEKCWIITSPSPSLPIMVYVEYLRLELDEAVLFYDGPSNEAQLLSKFDYQTSAGSQVISSGGNLTMVLQKSTSRSFIVFHMLYSWLFPGHCTYISLSSKTTVLTSRGFGQDNYPKYEYKCWILTSLDSTQIIKLYAQSFVLENSTSCSSDYMDIYEGPKRADDKLLHRWCGNQTNKILALSSGRSLHVAFVSNGLKEYPGFNIMATAIRPATSNTQGPCVYLPIADIDYIETKNYGMEHYPNNDYQCWSLTAIEPDKILAVRAEIFDIEYDPTCSADYLDVYDGPAKSRDNMLHHWCGIHSGKLLAKSSGRSLFLVFKSDHSTQFPGFQLEVKAEDRSTVEREFRGLPAGAQVGERKTSTTTITLLVMVGCVIIAIIVIIAYLVLRKKKNQTSPAPEVAYSANSINPMTLSNLSVGERGLADGTQVSAPQNAVSEAPQVTKDTAKLVDTDKNRTGGFWNEAAVYK